ncbi:MAG: SirB2 family protein, partial [Burkholderiaceae bacterium]|nr:SirB2 family protein [Burkholderiaceae bacterium]
LYIVLGTFALKRARSQGARLLCFLGAVSCLGYMVTVAVAHHPLGVFSVLAI